MSIVNISITWNTRVFEITYDNDWSKIDLDGDSPTWVNLTIISQDGQPFPLSKTGYHSNFISILLIEEHGGVEEYVRDWLDEEASSKAWKDFVEQSRQLTLF